MPNPEASLVVIACPHCGTRYQVAYSAIGARGRTVACAHCGQSWEARAAAPEPVVVPRQKDFVELAEEALDEKFVIEEQRHKAKREAAARAQEAAQAAKAKARADAVAASEARAAEKGGGKAKRTGDGAVQALIDAADADGAARSPEHQRTLDEIKAAIAGKPAGPAEPLDAAARRRQQRAFSKRQRSLHSALPMARLRRAARLASLAALIIVVGGGLMFRTAIVEQFPQLAASYAALGLPVNVIGLEFREVRTLKSLQQGSEVLVVDGTIASVASGEVALPQVIVTLVDAAGNSLYEWSMTPKATELEPGEMLPFETQLSLPPAGAVGVRLRFDTGRAPLKATNAPPPDATPIMQVQAPPPGAAVKPAPPADTPAAADTGNKER